MHVAIPRSERRRKRMAPNIAMVIFGGGIAIVMGYAAQAYFSDVKSTIGSYGILLAIIGLMIGIGVFLYGYRRSDFTLLEIIYPLTALYMLNYPIRGLFMLLLPHLANYVYSFPVTGAKTYISYALFLFDLGFLSFVLGYYWPGAKNVARMLPTLPWVNETRGFYGKGLAIYGIGLGAFVLLWVMGSALRFQWIEERRLTAAYNLLVLLSRLKLVGLYLVWVRALKRKKTLHLLPYIILIVELFSGVTTGSKQSIFQVIIALLFAYSYSNKKVTTRAIGLFGLFLLVFFPLVQTYRNVYKEEFGFRPDPRLSELVTLTDDVSQTFISQSSTSDTIVQVFNRANQLDYLAVITHRVPRYIGYTNTLWPAIITAFIPRFLWHEKTVLVLGRFMVSVILGSPSSTNAPVTNIGELYLNFGVIGVPIGMFILGILYQVIYAYFQRIVPLSSSIQGALYLAIFPSMLFLSTGIASFPASIARTTILMLVVLWLFFRQPRSYMRTKRS